MKAVAEDIARGSNEPRAKTLLSDRCVVPHLALPMPNLRVVEFADGIALQARFCPNWP